MYICQKKNKFFYNNDHYSKSQAILQKKFISFLLMKVKVTLLESVYYNMIITIVSIAIN